MNASFTLEGGCVTAGFDRLKVLDWKDYACNNKFFVLENGTMSTVALCRLLNPDEYDIPNLSDGEKIKTAHESWAARVRNGVAGSLRLLTIQSSERVMPCYLLMTGSSFAEVEEWLDGVMAAWGQRPA